MLYRINLRLQILIRSLTAKALSTMLQNGVKGSKLMTCMFPNSEFLLVSKLLCAKIDLKGLLKVFPIGRFVVEFCAVTIV